MEKFIGQGIKVAPDGQWTFTFPMIDLHSLLEFNENVSIKTHGYPLKTLSKHQSEEEALDIYLRGTYYQVSEIYTFVLPSGLYSCSVNSKFKAEGLFSFKITELGQFVLVDNINPLDFELNTMSNMVLVL